MIRPINIRDYTLNEYDIRNLRHGSGVKNKKNKIGNGLYGNGLYGNGLFGNGYGDGVWDSVKSGTKELGNFVVNNADKIGKVVDVVHKTTKAGLDIAKDVNDLHRSKELRKSQEESLRAKKESTSDTKNASDDAIFKKLRLQSEAIKKGKGLYLN
jgi:hypothetical protein